MARKPRKKPAQHRASRRAKKHGKTSRLPGYFQQPDELPAVERLRPGRGYKHLLLQTDVIDFLSLLPQYNDLSQGLEEIIFAPHREGTFGWHKPHAVAICAWDNYLWLTMDEGFIMDHEELLDRLGVEREQIPAPGVPSWEVRWTEDQARGFQLLGVLLEHLCLRRGQWGSATEGDASLQKRYSQQYMDKHRQTIWDRYRDMFEY
ncbi:MAG: hypothetical protein ACLFVU_03185 [Phycisphaerae bacterium]